MELLNQLAVCLRQTAYLLVSVYFDVGAKQLKVNHHDRFRSSTQGFGLEPLLHPMDKSYRQPQKSDPQTPVSHFFCGENEIRTRDTVTRMQV